MLERAGIRVQRRAARRSRTLRGRPILLRRRLRARARSRARGAIADSWRHGQPISVTSIARIPRSCNARRNEREIRRYRNGDGARPSAVHPRMRADISLLLSERARSRGEIREYSARESSDSGGTCVRCHLAHLRFFNLFFFFVIFATFRNIAPRRFNRLIAGQK